MSTLCCALIVDAGSPASEPVSPAVMRIRVPGSADSEDEAATTPEASTDSENDSSFESDIEEEDEGAGERKPSSR